MTTQLYEDMFLVQDKDPEGKRFDKVSRLVCQSVSMDTKLFLDVNTDIYPVEDGQRLQVMLASTLNLDGTPMDESFDPAVLVRPTLADKFEYVMHGRIFKCVEDKSAARVISVFISFGGLMMMLKGDVRTLAGLELDHRVFLLVRRT